MPGVTALLAGGGHAATTLQVMGGLYGYLLYVGQSFGIGQYATVANAFLRAAANGTVNYGQELTQQFPPNTAAGAVSVAHSSSQYTPVSAPADPSVITITGSGELIDPGAGAHSIQFLAGANADALVVHADGIDQIAGFDPRSDVLDLRSLLTDAHIDLNGNVAAVGNYLTITDQGPDALISFAADGQHGVGIATLRGLGAVVTSLDTLVASGAIRIA